MKYSLYVMPHAGALLHIILMTYRRQDESILLTPDDPRKYDLYNMLKKIGLFKQIIYYRPEIPSSAFTFTGSTNDLKIAMEKNITDIFQTNNISVEDISSVFITRDGLEYFSMYFYNRPNIYYAIIETWTDQIYTDSNNTIEFHKKRNTSESALELLVESGYFDCSYFDEIFLMPHSKLSSFKTEKIHYIDWNQYLMEMPNELKKQLSFYKKMAPLLNDTDIVLFNGRTVSRQALVPDNKIAYVYQLLLDYYCNSNHKITIKMHPAIPFDVKPYFKDCIFLDDTPIDFIAFEDDVVFSNAITISSDACKVLLQYKKTQKATIVGIDFFLYKDVIAQLDYIINALSVQIINKNCKLLFDSYCGSFLHSYVEINYPNLLKTNRGEDALVVFDYELTAEIVLKTSCTIVISNAHNVACCIDLIPKENALCVPIIIKPIIYGSFCEESDEYIIIITKNKNILNHFNNYKYCKKLYHSGAEVKSNDPISIDELRLFIPYNPKKINAFDKKMRDLVRFYPTYKTGPLPSYYIITRWLKDISECNVSWATERLLQIVQYGPDEDSDFIMKCCIDNLRYDVSKEIIINKRLDSISTNIMQYCILSTRKNVLIDGNYNIQSNELYDLYINANNGDISSIIKIVHLFRSPDKQNLQFASRWALKAANLGSGYGKDLYFSILREINTEESIKEYMSKAIEWTKKDKDPHAFAALGIAYLNGYGVPKDLKKSKKYLKKAIVNNIQWAYNHYIDVLYQIGTDESWKEMIDLIQKQIVQNPSPVWLIKLGRAYRQGTGVEKNLYKAKQLMYEASLLGSGWAKDQYFSILREIGSIESSKEYFDNASKWAESGDLNAMYALGIAYKYGINTEINNELSEQWIKKSQKS